MIIYGSKMYGVKNVVWGFGACQHCGVYGKHKSYNGKKFGHLYFIPLIPMGGTVRVMQECVKCKMARHMPEQSVRPLYERIESLMGACVAAAELGEHTFSDGESPEPVETGAFLLDAIELMYVSGYHREVDDLVALFDSDAARYEHALARGVIKEMRSGKADAVEHFQQAIEAAPDQVLPYLLASDLSANTGNAQQSLDYLDQASEVRPGNIQILLARLGPLEKLQQWDAYCAQYDQCVQMEPGLAKEKKLAKLRKKYGKKAGR